MRARFCAYALGKTRFVMDTTHDPRQDRDVWRSEIKRFCTETTFAGLSIDAVEVEDGVGWVTFTATLRQGGRDASFTERSRFVRTDAWRYADGERLPTP